MDARTVSNICAEYGLYGTVIYDSRKPIEGSEQGHMYIIAGTDPNICNSTLPEYIANNPDDIYRMINRSEDIFYPHIWAYDLTAAPEEMHAGLELVEYCKRANFVSTLYDEYNLSVPEKLRFSEVSALVDFRTGIHENPNDETLQKIYRKNLNQFFKREKSKNKIIQSWLAYFRSEKFPDNKGTLARIIGYFKRNKNITSFERLVASNKDFSKLSMQEYEYKLFSKLIKEKYPNVAYAIGEKEVIDHGLYNTKDGSPSPLGKRVTMEEYAVIRKEKFATESYDALEDLVPAYFEFRDVYYKDIDEPIVASIYNSIKLAYAKCDPLLELKERGDLALKKIPSMDFMNFVSLAKANNLKFYIDNTGDYAVPSLDHVNVIYNTYNKEKISNIMNYMMETTIEQSHMIESPKKESLNHIVNAAVPQPHTLSVKKRGHSPARNR